jgi:hypothetical protein
MRSVILATLLALLAGRRGLAESNNYYYFPPTDFESTSGSTYKFHIEALKGHVTIAELYVSPAARPIWNNNFNLYGSGSTTPLLDDFSYTSSFSGRGYVPRNLLFREYWAVDVADLLRSVNAPYVRIHASDVSFTKDAYLRVTTVVPEPSSAMSAIGVAATLIARHRRGGGRVVAARRPR